MRIAKTSDRRKQIKRKEKRKMKKMMNIKKGEI